MKKKISNRQKICIVLFLLVVAALYVYIYVVPKVSDIFVETYIAEYGTLEISEECSFLVVRDERLYTADNSGQVDRACATGKLMRRNSRIVTVGSTSHYSQDRGMVSYSYDGLEELYTPDVMNTIGIGALDNRNEEGDEKYPVKECISGSASKGDPVFKIVDNKAWYILCWLDAQQSQGLEAGKNISVRFSDGKEVKMTVYQINPQGDKNQIILSCNRYYEKFSEIRTGSCQLIKTSKSGILLESASIAEEDGIRGVYVVNKHGTTDFVPVSILADNGETAVAEKNFFLNSEGKQTETVKNYAEILRIQQKEESQGNKATEDKNAQDSEGSEQDAN